MPESSHQDKPNHGGALEPLLKDPLPIGVTQKPKCSDNLFPTANYIGPYYTFYISMKTQCFATCHFFQEG